MSNASPSNQSSTSQLITEAVQASTIIVIHPGSLYLRIGRATDSQPFIIPHVIARRNRSNKIAPQEDPYLITAVKLDKDSSKIINESQNALIATLNSCLTSEGKTRTSISKEKLTEFNKRAKPVLLPKGHPTVRHWTQGIANRDVIIGNDVLLMKPTEPYHIRWPIRRGRLNVNSSLGGSLTSVIADLESIWSLAIEKHLQISVKELIQYRAFLVIPDIYNRSHIKELLRLLLKRMKFGGVLISHEAVCATFGAGLNYACVVDIGDQKTSVCCVEDGFSPRVARLCLEFGGSDITQLFHHLLKQRGFPYSECKSESRLGGMLLQEIKENCCHINLNICGAHEKQFQVRIPDQPILQYTFLVGDECLIAPLALFNPELFVITGLNNKKMQTLERNPGDPEDPFDENYLIQTKRKYGESTEASGQGEGGDQGDDDLDGCEKDISADKEINNDQLLGIDQAILQCIDRCDNDDSKRRMYSCILLVGGGTLFQGIETWLHSRLSMQMPVQYRGQQIEIITRAKDIDPKITIWKGATVMSLLDTAQELWITENDWNKSGIRIMREKCSFVW